MIILLLILLFVGHSRTGIIHVFNSSGKYFLYSSFIECFNDLDFNETVTDQSMVLYNNDTETILNNSRLPIQTIDRNQFAETVVDLLLDLLEKANLSRTVSIIHNDTELNELSRQVDNGPKTTTIQLIDP